LLTHANAVRKALFQMLGVFAEVIRVVAMGAAKVGVEARRERDRERVLADLMRSEFGTSKKA
jgi:hypothetical protein